MAKKETIKVIGITKNNCITGIEFGEVEIDVPVTPVFRPMDKSKIERAQQAFTKAQQSRKSKLCNRTKKK
ncbi:MAG: hypothetical protein R8M37_02955 [Alphaproteobacteria bacterium]|nr:hypothetical protein [Alphaproteobacteria bacterium]